MAAKMTWVVQKAATLYELKPGLLSIIEAVRVREKGFF